APVQPAPSSLVEKGREDEGWKVHGGRADGRRNCPRAEGELGLARRDAVREQSNLEGYAARQQEEGSRSTSDRLQADAPRARDVLRPARGAHGHSGADAQEGAS